MLMLSPCTLSLVLSKIQAVASSDTTKTDSPACSRSHSPYLDLKKPEPKLPGCVVLLLVFQDDFNEQCFSVINTLTGLHQEMKGLELHLPLVVGGFLLCTTCSVQKQPLLWMFRLQHHLELASVYQTY